MKQVTILICALFLSAGLMAQEFDMLSKRGEPILPKAGEIALGIDAMPVLGYFGDLFNASSGNKPSFGHIDGLYTTGTNTIYVKYYLEDQVAVRGAVMIGHRNDINQEFVTMNQAIMDPLVTVTDKFNSTVTKLGIGGDYLMYRGKGRVQGYFGGGGFISYDSYKMNYTYGNAITTEFNAPTWYDFGGLNAPITGSERVLEKYGNNNFGITLRGIIGVEYFFAPKISVGGEMGLGFQAYRKGGFETVERWTGQDVEVETTEIAHDGFLDLQNFTSGSLFIMFHF